MKHNKISLKWKVFGYFLVFTAVMLVILWLSQTVFLAQFYEGIKMRSLRACATSVNTTSTQTDVERLAEQYDVCIRIIDTDLNDVASAQQIPNCILHTLPRLLLMGFYLSTAESGGERVTQMSYEPRKSMTSPQISVNNENDRGRTIIYTRIESEGMVMIESLISPVNATVETLRIQLGWVTGILTVLALLIAVILSRNTSRPLEKINQSAKLLAAGNYDAKFEVKGYREISELADTLNYAACELSKVEGLRRELIANISHDLRTPLTMITAYAEVMRDLPGENTPENVQVIIDEATRLTSLVNDLLEISKLGSGVQSMNAQKFNLTESLRRILHRYTKLVEQEGYTIDFQCDADAWVCADEPRIEQVAYNLINNAITYTGASKRVLIRQQIRENVVRVEICDEGEGIAEKDLPLIWERYYKVNQPHKRAQMGSGLGLSIVRGILEMHGARYGVQSVLGKGSTFWFELPLAHGLQVHEE